MQLTYYFGRYEDEPFDIYVDSEDYLYEIKKDPKKVEELVKELYEAQDDKGLVKWAKEEFDINDVKDINVKTDDGREFCYAALSEFFDDEVLKEYREDELLDFYSDVAKEQYEDSKVDPYTYNGVSPRDFY